MWIIYVQWAYCNSYLKFDPTCCVVSIRLHASVAQPNIFNCGSTHYHEAHFKRFIVFNIHFVPSWIVTKKLILPSTFYLNPYSIILAPIKTLSNSYNPSQASIKSTKHCSSSSIAPFITSELSLERISSTTSHASLACLELIPHHSVMSSAFDNANLRTGSSMVWGTSLCVEGEDSLTDATFAGIIWGIRLILRRVDWSTCSWLSKIGLVAMLLWVVLKMVCEHHKIRVRNFITALSSASNSTLSIATNAWICVSQAPSVLSVQEMRWYMIFNMNAYLPRWSNDINCKHFDAGFRQTRIIAWK